MARAIWNGAISFSLVHIPVSLYPAARVNELDLDMLDKRDFSPVGYQRYNKTTGKPVEWSDIVKGYQHEKGDYVVLTDEDFKRANVKATQTVDIEAFVDAAEIPPYYFETPYFLVPGKKAGKVYGLLRDALSKSGKVGVATIVIRTRQSTAALIPVGDTIMLNTLRFATEILSPQSLPDGASAAPHAAGKELQMALKLIDDMSEPWHPEHYRDTYTSDLLKRVREKVKAGETRTLTVGEKAPRSDRGDGKVVDLVALLQQSLGRKKTAGDAKAPAAVRSARTVSDMRRRAARSRVARR